MAKTEVLLRENLKNLGKCGDIVRVAPGYARNFLLPRKLAMQATEENKKAMAKRRAMLDVEEARQTAEIVAKVQALAGVTLSTTMKADENGRTSTACSTRRWWSAALREGLEHRGEGRQARRAGQDRRRAQGQDPRARRARRRSADHGREGSREHLRARRRSEHPGARAACGAGPVAWTRSRGAAELPARGPRARPSAPWPPAARSRADARLRPTQSTPMPMHAAHCCRARAARRPAARAAPHPRCGRAGAAG